jgi:hypothetical protein
MREEPGLEACLRICVFASSSACVFACLTSGLTTDDDESEEKASRIL